MATILEGIRQELQRLAEKGFLEEFALAFNNDKRFRRCNNARPRTDLMVKGCEPIDNYREAGFLPHAMEAAWPDIQPDPARSRERLFSRYVDIGYLAGEWWEGKRYWQWIAEVENSWKERKGTIRDLLLTQAKRKLAVLYPPGPDLDTTGIREEIRAIVTEFAGLGFSESRDAQYEILLVPDELEYDGELVLHAVLLSFSFSPSLQPSDIRCAAGAVQCRNDGR